MLSRRRSQPIAGRRVLITGAARGIGAATARRLHEQGARVALAGIEPDALAAVASDCGGAPWWECDVTDRSRVETVVQETVAALGGLDVVMANAGVAAQIAIVGGDADVWDRTIDVNLHGVFNTVRAAGPHVSHENGYVLVVSSLAAAMHLPLLGAYAASKAAVEALGDSLRSELRPTGARVGVAYFAEIDTDMTSRGFGTEAAQHLTRGGAVTSVAPLSKAIDAVERGIARRASRVVAPRWVAAVLPIREPAQRVVELVVAPRVRRAVEIARREDATLTTEQPT